MLISHEPQRPLVEVEAIKASQSRPQARTYEHTDQGARARCRSCSTAETALTGIRNRTRDMAELENEAEKGPDLYSTKQICPRPFYSAIVTTACINGYGQSQKKNNPS